MFPHAARRSGCGSLRAHSCARTCKQQGPFALQRRPRRRAHGARAIRWTHRVRRRRHLALRCCARLPEIQRAARRPGPAPEDHDARIDVGEDPRHSPQLELQPELHGAGVPGGGPAGFGVAVAEGLDKRGDGQLELFHLEAVSLASSRHRPGAVQAPCLAEADVGPC